MKITRRNFLIFSGFHSASLISFRHREKKLPYSYPNPKRTHHSDVWIELSLKNLGWNLERIRETAKVPIMGVIKANAYGHGVIEVGRYLLKKGIDSLMVCKFQEAQELRESGITCPIHNFGPLDSTDAKMLIKKDISQSVFTAGINDLNNMALSLGKKAKIHIHIDTGLGRMGIPDYKALPFIEKVASLKGLHILGISTTLTEDEKFDLEQLERFLTICKKAEKKGVSLGLKHAASSAAVLSSSSYHLDMVRPGISLYGYYPSDKTQNQDRLSLKPVLQLKSFVACIKTLRPGDSIGYHRIYKAKKREKFAVIPLGYSDGYPFKAAGKGFVLIKGERFPIIAGITANHMEIRLKKDSQVSIGDEVVLIGSQKNDKISAFDMAQWAETSTYKILIGLNPLLPKKITA